MLVTAHHSLLPRPQCSSTILLSPLFVSSKTSLLPSPTPALLCSHCPSTRFHGLKIKARQWKKVSPVCAASESSSDRWLLEPIGDGDTRHIGYKVERPGAYEIASSAVTVGRLPDKADLVIPVATVSGLHARIQKKEGSLLVTDLDSTNGTFIDDKKLRPGVAAPVSPGVSITFGDIHLAMFRVYKLEGSEVTEESEDSPAKTEADNATEG